MKPFTCICAGVQEFVTAHACVGQGLGLAALAEKSQDQIIGWDPGSSWWGKDARSFKKSYSY